MIGSLGRWGWIAFGLVGIAASQGDTKPLYETGKGVPAAAHAGKPERTMQQMEKVYLILKENDWDYTKVPFHLLQATDHHLGEEPFNRAPRTSTFVIPEDSVYDEIALYTSLYFRRGVRVFPGRTECTPTGFYLVMYRNGKIEKIAGDKVRLLPLESSEEGASVPVFPGMSEYSTELKRLPEYQEEWYKGPPLRD